VRAVYGSRPPIASKPDSSPPERPGLENITSQPWSEATCPCTTSASAYLRFVTIFLLEKTRQSTRKGGTGASCVRPWLTRDIVWTGLFWRGQARFRGDQRSGTLNSALSTPGYLLALLRELSQCPRAFTEIIMPKQVRKTNLDIFLVPFQKKGWKINHHVSNLRTRGFPFHP